MRVTIATSLGTALLLAIAPASAKSDRNEFWSVARTRVGAIVINKAKIIKRGTLRSFDLYTIFMHDDGAPLNYGYSAQPWRVDCATQSSGTLGDMRIISVDDKLIAMNPNQQPFVVRDRGSVAGAIVAFACEDSSSEHAADFRAMDAPVIHDIQDIVKIVQQNAAAHRAGH